jgi:undecaprenyl-diphosphatase
MREAFLALASFERRACEVCNRVNLIPSWGSLFAVVSRLGNGLFWYVLMGTLPFAAGRIGLVTSARMAVTGLACTAVYSYLKRRIRRPRPCHSVGGLHTTVAPLDRFSFPSGHTMHAFAFTILATAACPVLGWILVPFTLLVAGSRLVLGLHWCSDVVAGALVGSGLAWGALLVS